MAHKLGGEPMEVSETVVLTLGEVTLIRRYLPSDSGYGYEDSYPLYKFFDKLEDEMIDRKETL